MANKKISELPAATSLTTADLLPVVQGGVTMQVTPDLLPLSTAGAGAATAAQNYAVQRGNHTGTQSADTITDGTTNKTYTATEKTKLAGIATGATANRTDAATDTAITNAINGVINGAPGALDTLKELADALADDANYAATITTALAGKTSPADVDAKIATQAASDATTYVSFGVTAPDHTITPVWVDTSTTPQVVKGWSGTAWVAIGGGAGTVSDATTTAKGVVQLAGDLAGTAAAPVVPALASKAPLASPAFSGTPTVPTATAGTNTTQAASTAFVAAAIAAIVNAAPGTLDTLKELADALGDDPNYAATVTTLLGQKAPLVSPSFTGTPTSTTPAAGDVSTRVSTTAFGAANFVSLLEPASQQLSTDGASLASPWQQPFTRSLRPPSKVITRFPSGHGWTGGTDDTTVTLFTDRTLKKTTDGAGTFFHLTGPTITAVDCSTSAIRVMFRVSDPTKVANLGFLVTTSSGNTYNGPMYAYLAAEPNEWCIATIPRSSLTATGSPSWASITQFDLYFSDIGGGAGNAFTISLGAVELIPDLASVYPSGVFILEADDGYLGQKTYLAPVVGQRGIPVTFNPIGDRFVGGTPASGMTAADLRVFQDLHGWQMSCHAWASSVHNGSPSTAAALEQDFQRQKHWFRANGLHSGADHFAESPGSGTPIAAGATMDAVRKSFRSARTNVGFYETAVASDPLRLKSILFSGNTVAQLQTNINAVAGAGGALILTLHDVIAGSTNGTSNGLPAIAQTNLATVLDYAAGKGMVFRTRADWLEGR